MIRVKGKDICSGRIRGHDITRIRCKGQDVWKKAVDTAITFSPSSMSKGGGYPYHLNATIYRGIDLSLYKGIQFYVSEAYIDVDFKNATNMLSVCAYDSSTGTSIGEHWIASNYRYSNDTYTNNSCAGLTLTITFTQDTGTGEIRVVGTGTSTCDGGRWKLSNAVLLAR